MKIYISLVVIFLTTLLNAQNVFEYNLSNNLKFKVFSEEEGTFYKISKEKEFKQNTPENVALSSFFSYSNEISSKLYLDKNKYVSRDESEFDLIKNTNAKDAYIQLLHKTNYSFEGNQMAYIMFIAKIKDIPYPFPTLLSLIKKKNKWYLFQRYNQEKIRKCFLMIKPCVLSNVIEGISSDNDINRLISSSKSEKGGVDFTKLFDELVLIKKNKSLYSKLTMSQNADCFGLNFKKNVEGKNTLTGIIEDAKIGVFKKQDSILISKIKKNNDSIILKSRLDVDFYGKKFSMVKYHRITPNGVVNKENIKLDTNSLEGPMKELFFLYEKLNTNVFKNLSTSIEESSIKGTELYKKTRGVYNILNISNMYELYQTNKNLFDNYFYE